MQFVGAGLQVDVDHAARRAPVFGVVAVGDHVHLTDGFHRRADRVSSLVQEVDGVDVVIDAIQQEVVLTVGANAVGGKSAVGRIARSRFRRHYARGEARQIREVALPAQRNILHRFGIECRADLCALGLQQRRRGRDFDGLVDVADRQSNRNAGALAGGQRDVFLLSLFEPGSGYVHRVSGWLEGGTNKFAGAIGDGFIGKAGCLIGDLDNGIDDDPAG